TARWCARRVSARRPRMSPSCAGSTRNAGSGGRRASSWTSPTSTVARCGRRGQAGTGSGCRTSSGPGTSSSGHPDVSDVDGASRGARRGPTGPPRWTRWYGRRTTMTAQLSTDLWLPVPYWVAANREETADTVTLTLRPEGLPIREFLPGQFTMLYVFGVGEVP